MWLVVMLLIYLFEHKIERLHGLAGGILDLSQSVQTSEFQASTSLVDVLDGGVEYALSVAIGIVNQTI